MDSEKDKIHILLINEDSKETKDIKSWLEQDMRVPYALTHCVKVSEALPRIIKADLVVLKPQMEGFSSPNEVYQSIGDVAFQIPIIVLADADGEHNLSTYVMEQGAADVIVRGQFSRMVDAIEFALIRQRITTETKSASDKKLSDSHAKENADFQLSKSDMERHKQILRMFSGDYSIDQRE